MKLTKAFRGTALAVLAAVAASASAATSITIDSVAQRWPWNNKVDITYTIVGGQTLCPSNFCKIVFTTVIDGTAYTIDGVKDVGASANAGTHTVTWTAPSGVKSADCTMSAAVYAADAPSGDDYLVIDLTKTGAESIAFEGMLASQSASNDRYNTAEYKTDKLVLKKVPAGGPYPTGEYNSSRWANAKNWLPGNINSPTNWITDRDYYIGVFPVTQYQYTKLYGSNPSGKNYGGTETNPVAHRPVENLTWNTLRLADTASTSSIPTVAAADTGTFLQRLNYITGNRFGFDLPTEVMFEIAQRAGTTTMYPWGDAWATDKAVYADNSGGLTVAVGSYPANDWGFYDMTGNVYEWCLDDYDNSRTYDRNTYYPDADLTARSDAFTPACVEGATYRRLRGGGHWQERNDQGGADFRTAVRRSQSQSSTNAGTGFRVSMIVR